MGNAFSSGDDDDGNEQYRDKYPSGNYPFDEDDEHFASKYNKLERDHHPLEKKYSKLLVACRHLRKNSLRKHYYFH